MFYRTRPSIYFTRSESGGVRIAGEIYPLRAVPNSEEARDVLKMRFSRSRLVGLIENVQWYAVEQEGQSKVGTTLQGL